MATIDDDGRLIRVHGGAISSNTKVTDDMCYIQKIVWYNITTNGHKAMIKDRHGKPRFPLICASAGSGNMLTYEFDTTPFPSDGLYVDDLDSGELFFYIATRPGVA